MITYLTKSIFDSEAQTLVNTVNTVGVMGKGLALEFRHRYPGMYDAYRKACLQGEIKIGGLMLHKLINATPWILNFPTKEHWRNPSKMEYLEAGLQTFVKAYLPWGIRSISFPQLGCQNGGLKWDDVQSLMERYLGNLEIPVFIHIR